MDWLGLVKGSVVSIVLLVPALWLLRSARQKAMRNKRRTLYIPPDQSDFVRCVHGNHMVSKRRAVIDGETYDGTRTHICYTHRLDRKRLMNARESEAS